MAKTDVAAAASQDRVVITKRRRPFQVWLRDLGWRHLVGWFGVDLFFGLCRLRLGAGRITGEGQHRDQQHQEQQPGRAHGRDSAGHEGSTEWAFPEATFPLLPAIMPPKKVPTAAESQPQGPKK